MPKKKDFKLENFLTFGFEQTLTIPEWWTEEGFTATSDTPLKREKMLSFAKILAHKLNGNFKESLDIWDHLQYETFDSKDNPSFVITMDPGSIEVKTPPVLFKDIKKMSTPLIEAAEEAGLVPYRNWWYGIKGGTEGGCHVNMGGFNEKNNPLIMFPDLALKYACYIHNRPFLTYPFMGPDVGPEGNAMRVDEKEGADKVFAALDTYTIKKIEGENLSIDEIYSLFKDTNLINEKSSAPSLHKLKSPFYLIEDRAQEALRSSDDFELVAKIRLLILEKLIQERLPEQMNAFKRLHQEDLTSYSLWEKFQNWANEIELNPVPYQHFFERQFPIITHGDNPPSFFKMREGKRPRVITSVKKKNNVVVSKTVDTNYKRFEFSFCPEDSSTPFTLEIQGDGVEYISPLFKNNGHLNFGEIGNLYYLYIDIKCNPEKPTLNIILNKGKNILEQKFFNTKNMAWEDRV